MAKATGQKATDAAAKKKPATTKAAATKAKTATTTKSTATRVAAKKAPTKKPLVKKAAAATPAARKAKAPAKKPATKVKSAGRAGGAGKTAAGKTKTRTATRAAKAQAPARARRGRSAVLEVSPLVIDTSAAAEVAARLVVDGSGVASPQPEPLGNLFEPPAPVVQRGSSALRHVKESLHRPVAAQLESVLGPAPVPAAAMRRFAQGGRNARVQRLRGSTNFHVAQPTVPHRTAGAANVHDSGRGE